MTRYETIESALGEVGTQVFRCDACGEVCFLVLPQGSEQAKSVRCILKDEGATQPEDDDKVNWKESA